MLSIFDGYFSTTQNQDPAFRQQLLNQCQISKYGVKYLDGASKVACVPGKWRHVALYLPVWFYQSYHTVTNRLNMTDGERDTLVKLVNYISTTLIPQLQSYERLARVDMQSLVKRVLSYAGGERSSTDGLEGMSVTLGNKQVVFGEQMGKRGLSNLFIYKGTYGRDKVLIKFVKTCTLRVLPNEQTVHEYLVPERKLGPGIGRCHAIVHLGGHVLVKTKTRTVESHHVGVIQSTQLYHMRLESLFTGYSMEVLEYIHGPDLAEMSKDMTKYKRHLPKIAWSAFNALCSLHNSGLLMEDIRPENMVWCPKEEMVYIIDMDSFSEQNHEFEVSDNVRPEAMVLSSMLYDIGVLSADLSLEFLAANFPMWGGGRGVGTVNQHRTQVMIGWSRSTNGTFGDYPKSKYKKVRPAQQGGTMVRS
jgi:hypothetical protein